VGYASSSVGELASQQTNQPASWRTLLYFSIAVFSAGRLRVSCVCVCVCVCARARALCLFLPTPLS
jgi:hypothetical protein